MLLNFLDRVGDWNPQLLREIKGRLKLFSTLIAIATSLVVQLVVFLFQLGDLPNENYRIFEKYCGLKISYEEQRRLLQTQLEQRYQELQTQFFYYTQSENFNASKVQELRQQIEQVRNQQNDMYRTLDDQFCPVDQINMPLWWRDHWEYIFLTLSVIFIFTLLVAGTYLLINNLATEERRGTLNFLRLSPQSETSILTGKLLGVPILVYLVILIALPLHFLAGHQANIATSYILTFWVVMTACCIFFYSLALLFGLCCRGFSSFQPWLGSGAVLLLLFVTMALASSSSYTVENAWLRMFSPFDITNYLFPNLFRRYNGSPLEQFQFFNLEVGKSVVGVVTLHVLNYSLWTYWAWQALKRCFRNPNSTLLRKQQSYFLVATWQIVNLGFYLGSFHNSHKYISYNNAHYYLWWLYLLNLLAFLGLMAILSPHRQTIQDWARYRFQNVSNSNIFGKNSLLGELMFGEKSPAIVAIVINFVIAATPFVLGIVLWNSEEFLLVDKIKALLAVGLLMGWIIIYATLAQLMLMMKTSKRALWAIGVVGAATFLPPMILGMLNISPTENHILWLFSGFSWVGIPEARITTIFMTFVSQLAIVTLLNFQLVRQVRLAGESTTKTLLSSAKG
jgi:hypothetical protein